MAAPTIGLACWLALMTLLWSLYPLMFSQSRGIVILAILTAGLTMFGWVTATQLPIVWSGVLGLFNLTLALLISSQPPNVWLGLSAGITLLALLDGSQRFAYVKRCHLEPGVLTVWLAVFMRISALSLAAGIALVLLVVNLSTQGGIASGAGVLTIIGASLFVGLLALLLLYTGRWPERD